MDKPATETTYTSAPPDYDGFGTVTVRDCAGVLKSGKVLREVATPAEHVEWQRNRYYSGGIYATFTPVQFEQAVEYKLVAPAEPPHPSPVARHCYAKGSSR